MMLASNLSVVVNEPMRIQQIDCGIILRKVMLSTVFNQPMLTGRHPAPHINRLHRALDKRNQHYFHYCQRLLPRLVRGFFFIQRSPDLILTQTSRVQQLPHV